MEGRGDVLEDLADASVDHSGRQLPLYIKVDEDNLILYYDNEPFTQLEAME
ncbi:MAG: hypothetical protein ACREAU_00470 [Nitrosopumilaceae archaeon]